MNSKKAFFILLLAFIGAGLWQRDNITATFREHFDFSWLSFKEENFAAARTKYMEQKKGKVKIAIVPPNSDYILEKSFFDTMMLGVEIAAKETKEKNPSLSNLEYFTAPNREDYDTLDEYVYEIGTDPAVLSMILPVSQRTTRQTETLAEYMGMVTFRTTHLFTPREEGSYLVFNNTYPVNLYSIAIANYAKQRNLQSVAMVTENNPRDNGFSSNIETWLAKQNVPVTTALTFEKDMINMSIFKEFEKKFDVLGIDGVFWGMMGPNHIQFISDFFSENPELMKSADHIMFLPINPDNIVRLKTLLQRPEVISLDPIVAYPTIQESPLKDTFDKRYFATFNKKANHAAYYGYDTYMLIANAVANCATLSPQTIAAYLEGNSFQGILASYDFDKNGRLEQNQVGNVIQLGRIENGKLVELKIDQVKPVTNRKKQWDKLEFSLKQ